MHGKKSKGTANKFLNVIMVKIQAYNLPPL